jgi:hypothetical protein
MANLSYIQAKDKITKGKVSLLSKAYGDDFKIIYSEELDYGWLFVITFDLSERKHFFTHYTLIVDEKYNITHLLVGDCREEYDKDWIKGKRKCFFYRLAWKVTSFFEDRDYRRIAKERLGADG